MKNKKTKNVIIKTIIFIGISIFIIGLMKYIKQKKIIIENAKEAELSFENNNQIDINENFYNNNSTIITNGNKENENNPNTAIGILTFSNNSDYKVAIYDNVTIETLKNGAGRLTGSAKLNEKGNCILYGHRDSSFKAIWNIKIGDELELKSRKYMNGQITIEDKKYKVKNIYITDPYDEKICQGSSDYKLTLVTCYPFTYSGMAKQRCVVESYMI